MCLAATSASTTSTTLTSASDISSTKQSTELGSSTTNSGESESTTSSAGASEITTAGGQTGGELTTSNGETSESTTTLGATSEINTSEQSTGWEFTTTGAGASGSTTTLAGTSEITTAEGQTGGELTTSNSGTSESTTTLGATTEITSSEQSTGWELTTSNSGTTETTTEGDITGEITITGESTSESTTTLGGTGEIIITGESTSPTTTTVGSTQGSTGSTETPSGVFIVVKTGLFSSVDTWKGGQIPTGNCSIVIPAGFTLTFEGEILDIEVTTLTIAGSFIISSTAGFTFQYVINIIIEDGGTFEDQTSTHILYFFAGSLCTFYSKASFVGSATIIYQFTALPATNNLGSNFTLGASFTGAFTFGILFSGEIQFFSSVTFIVGISGSFSVGGTWLGGIAPTADICSLVGGCGLYIPSGCSLLTASLNGRLEINFIFITVAEGGTFELGELSWAGGFRFLFDFTFNIYGTLSFASSSGGSIYLPFGCVFNFFAEAHFQSSIQITLMTFDVKLGDVEGIFVINLSTSFVGPYYISISFNGQITLSSQRKYQKQVYFSKV